MGSGLENTTRTLGWVGLYNHTMHAFPKANLAVQLYLFQTGWRNLVAKFCKALYPMYVTLASWLQEVAVTSQPVGQISMHAAHTVMDVIRIKGISNSQLHRNSRHSYPSLAVAGGLLPTPLAMGIPPARLNGSRHMGTSTTLHDCTSQ